MSALLSLATDINREHASAFGKANEALEHARRAGDLLLEAKAAVPHGQWLPWLAANVGFGERTAQGYMRLAPHWNALKSKCATAAGLPLRDALHALAEPPHWKGLVDRIEALAADIDAFAEGDADDDATYVDIHERLRAMPSEGAEVMSDNLSAIACASIVKAARAGVQAGEEAAPHERAQARDPLAARGVEMSAHSGAVHPDEIDYSGFASDYAKQKMPPPSFEDFRVDEWPSPQPIHSSMEPEPYPLDALPDLVRSAIEEVQKFVQAPEAMVASCALAALSLATQAHVDVDVERADSYMARAVNLC